MNLVLIGYRGTGKSLVSKLLAERLHMSLFSSDEEVVRRAGMPISEIVAKLGWTGFRDMESEVARQLGALDNAVIDTGGGIIERSENVDALAGNARIIWLKASVDTIVSRIETDTERPALTEGKTFTEEVAEILQRRNPLYQKTAHYTIDTDSLTPDQIADQVLSFWSSR
ncbi:shikimate kinase [Geotalea daltonii FRC-32]|uniref:Shikimate kinase n=1 Tax=Geotalea daltonii (strain DSM 22248 / JCM 15807 / FRC-32) TaxID=316067 RepID=B9M9J4_GEODF|nr:shikimate kinase [Geotalea daltonii]ACM20566.1 shikimate kinase [Geotalea daltonii FRC-32]